MKTVAFFNNKGGVGKTSLVYHLSWMFAEKGVRTLAVDLDPQSNLTSMFLPEERLEELWTTESGGTISDYFRPLHEGTGDILAPRIEKIFERPELGLIAGNLALSGYEDELSSSWTQCLSGNPRDFRVTTAFYRIIAQAAKEHGAKLVLIDVGPNLGAINRCALIAADRVVLPLAPDLFSLQGLKNLGPTLKAWREGWKERKIKMTRSDLLIPDGYMMPVGYIVMQHGIVREDRPFRAYQHWIDKIPCVYREYILQNAEKVEDVKEENDTYRLAQLKHYRSLMALAQEARKPMFLLSSADGAMGAHGKAVRDCHKDFYDLAARVERAIDATLN